MHKALHSMELLNCTMQILMQHWTESDTGQCLQMISRHFAFWFWIIGYQQVLHLCDSNYVPSIFLQFLTLAVYLWIKLFISDLSKKRKVNTYFVCSLRRVQYRYWPDEYFILNYPQTNQHRFHFHVSNQNIIIVAGRQVMVKSLKSAMFVYL